MKAVRNKIIIYFFLIFISQFTYGQISVDFESDSLSNIMGFASKEVKPIYFPKLNRIYLSVKKNFAVVITSQNQYDSIVKYKLFDSDGKVIGNFNGVQLSNCMILSDGDLVVWGTHFSEAPIAQRFLIIYSRFGKVKYKHESPFNFDLQVIPVENSHKIVYFGSNLSNTEFGIYLLNMKYKIISQKKIDMQPEKGIVCFDKIESNEIKFFVKNGNNIVGSYKLNCNDKW